MALALIWYYIITAFVIGVGLLLMLGRVIRYAIITDSKGEYIDRVKFKATDKTFRYGKRTYNVILEATHFNVKQLFGIWKNRFYFYDLDNPNPKILDKKNEPIIDTELYDVMMENRIATELANQSKSSLSALLTRKNIIIFIIALLAIWWLSSHGWKLT